MMLAIFREQIRLNADPLRRQKLRAPSAVALPVECEATSREAAAPLRRFRQLDDTFNCAGVRAGSMFAFLEKWHWAKAEQGGSYVDRTARCLRGVCWPLPNGCPEG
eukprot:7479965-Alexandrium_andersonii.AAC.1